MAPAFTPAHGLDTRVRDGVLLAADVYRPADGGPRPAILLRTPYGKDGHRDGPWVGKALARGIQVTSSFFPHLDAATWERVWHPTYRRGRPDRHR